MGPLFLTSHSHRRSYSLPELQSWLCQCLHVMGPSFLRVSPCHPASTRRPSWPHPELSDSLHPEQDLPSASQPRLPLCPPGDLRGAGGPPRWACQSSLCGSASPWPHDVHSFSLISQIFPLLSTPAATLTSPLKIITPLSVSPQCRTSSGTSTHHKRTSHDGLKKDRRRGSEDG